MVCVCACARARVWVGGGCQQCLCNLLPEKNSSRHTFPPLWYNICSLSSVVDSSSPRQTFPPVWLYSVGAPYHQTTVLLVSHFHTSDTAYSDAVGQIRTKRKAHAGSIDCNWPARWPVELLGVVGQPVASYTSGTVKWNKATNFHTVNKGSRWTFRRVSVEFTRLVVRMPIAHLPFDTCAEVKERARGERILTKK
jgi:hypothetical protein